MLHLAPIYLLADLYLLGSSGLGGSRLTCRIAELGGQADSENLGCLGNLNIFCNTLLAAPGARLCSLP